MNTHGGNFGCYAKMWPLHEIDGNRELKWNNRDVMNLLNQQAWLRIE